MKYQYIFQSDTFFTFSKIRISEFIFVLNIANIFIFSERN